MKDIILKYILHNYLYLQIVPAVIGLVFIKKMNINYVLFVLLLWYGIFNEIGALYYTKYIFIGENKIFYNIYNVIYFAFLFQLFYKKRNNKVFKKIIIITSLFFFVGIAYEVLIKQMNYHNQTLVIPYVIGCFGIIISVCFYLINLLTSKKKENNFRDLFLWVLIAHFFYYLGFTPIKIGENYLEIFKQSYILNLEFNI